MFDLFPNEGYQTDLDRARNPGRYDPSFWGGFSQIPSMFAKYGVEVARGIDIVGAAFPIIADKALGTNYTDQYFKEHDEMFKSAVDYWTPPPNSVGTAANIIGNLVPTIAGFAINPAIPIGKEILGTSEDLVNQGVPAKNAVAVGLVRGTGLALGIRAGNIGNTLLKQIASGAAVNVAQSVATEGISRQILEVSNTEAAKKAAKNFDPWDVEGRVIDALMGAAFGGVTHLTKGETPENVKKITDLKESITPTQEAAILTGNQVRHLESTMAPGIPEDGMTLTKQVDAAKSAVESLLNDKPVDVGTILQDAKFKPDPVKEAQTAENNAAIKEQANTIIDEAVSRGTYRDTSVQLSQKLNEVSGMIKELDTVAKGSPEETALLKKIDDAQLESDKLQTKLNESLAPIKDLPPKRIEASLEPKVSVKDKLKAEAKPELPKPPEVIEAEARLRARPDMTTTDEKGNTVNLSNEMKIANNEVVLANEKGQSMMEVALQCLLGNG